MEKIYSNRVFPMSTKRLYKINCLVFIFIILLNPLATLSENLKINDINKIKDIAIKKNLSASKSWKALLHYYPSIFYREKSIVDDKNFFLSKNGKTNPKEELLVSIEKFFFTKSNINSYNTHPQCKFPARYEWLKENLNLKDYKDIECKEFKKWEKDLNTKSISIIFPTSYVNNPASAFGHTLIRLDSTSPLLSYTASYSANIINSDNAILFAVKGIFGGYKGRFGILPYYKKVKEYGDIENRDIWEYQLNLKEKDIKKGIKHLWELKDIEFDYYYFDDNCAFIILSYLNAINPNVDLFSSLPPWVIPIDTIKSLKKNNLIKKTKFRPSSASILKHKSKNLKKQIIDLSISASKDFKVIKSENFLSLNDKDKVDVLELAYEKLYYDHINKENPKEEHKKLALNLLKERSKIKIKTKEIPYKTPSNPEDSQSTLKFSLGLGLLDSKKFYDISFRPAYHELIDDSVGYDRLTEIKFMEITTRHLENKGIKLQKFIPLEITSLNEENPMIKPLSWKLSIGGERKEGVNNQNKFISFANFSLGKNLNLTDSNIFYLLANTGYEYGRIKHKKNSAFGLGLNTGLLLNLKEKISTNISTNITRFINEGYYLDILTKIESRYTLTKTLSLRLNIEQKKRHKKTTLQTSLTLDYFPQ